jgi:hypothetical protein
MVRTVLSSWIVVDDAGERVRRHSSEASPSRTEIGTRYRTTTLPWQHGRVARRSEELGMAASLVHLPVQSLSREARNLHRRDAFAHGGSE